ncbi:ABC transporter permease [Streptomyces beijiangensis]|uniref:Transport permease protein n=2 Tax=Streptomyces beijiangensis TaxID=163361 RepID=A0A939FD11_9ACTN|nr:ABC transporter permease [Streptomyces beijiangensis]MBO0516367.1 ABC transporter permease [Streptomyces beijiangensis]
MDAQPPQDLTAYAIAHGLAVSGARPSLVSYVKQIWGRRHFITTFATAKLTAQYSQAKMGQVWQVMTPLLNAAVYYFIFGILMNTKRGIPDFLPWLVCGVFIWSFTSQSIMAGTRSLTSNMGLVRALHFPRASLPIAYAIQQLQQLLFSMGALVVILAFCGEYPKKSWLLAVPALLLQSVFNTGLSMIMARITSRAPDIAQLMPFILRTWMYTSGVMWSIDKVLNKDHLPHLVVLGLQCNPAAVYIDLMRFALVDSFTASDLPPHVWIVAVVWALVAGVGGFIYFWKAEESYGRG